jgi:hypothetical protein
MRIFFDTSWKEMSDKKNTSQFEKQSINYYTVTGLSTSGSDANPR